MRPSGGRKEHPRRHKAGSGDTQPFLGAWVKRWFLGPTPRGPPWEGAQKPAFYHNSVCDPWSYCNKCPQTGSKQQ